MKKVILSVLAIAAIGAVAVTTTTKTTAKVPIAKEVCNKEVWYVCTGNNVYVRTGPGKQYAPCQSDAGTVYVMKGDMVLAQGGVRNGYRYVCASLEGYGVVYGWMSTKYLRRLR